MTEAAKMRMERIERLLRELEFEIVRGMMEREIEEEMGFRFMVPVSKHFARGVVACEFRTRPTPLDEIGSSWVQPGGRPNLRLVKAPK